MDNLTPGISTLVGFGDRMVFGPLWEGARCAPRMDASGRAVVANNVLTTFKKAAKIQPSATDRQYSAH